MKLQSFKDFVEEETTTTTQLQAIEARLRRIVTSARRTNLKTNADQQWFVDQALKIAQRFTGKGADPATTLRALSLCAVGAVIAGEVA